MIPISSPSSEPSQKRPVPRNGIFATAAGSHQRDPTICRNCQKNGVRTFYEVRDIPVHSVLLMPTREKALNYTRRDLKLGFCADCGFIGNTLFEPEVHEYSDACEETQGFSPTFDAFSRSLARRWVAEYGLQGKSVLEVGCGKGEFLTHLVEAGVRRGIGIDPAYVAGRLTSPAVATIDFIQDLYDERYHHLRADVVCCRHTLEHIAPTYEFIRAMRNTIGDRPDTLVLFELPDARRVMEEAAFWDIYYEHCSYFTSGSLARLFRMNGFELLELELEYDNQYIVLAARPAAQPTQPSRAAENDLTETTALVAAFPKHVAILKQRWLSALNDRKSAGQKIVIWGGGSKAVAFITTLQLTDQIDYVVDVNPHKHEKFLPGSGHAVLSPSTLIQQPPNCIVLRNPIYKTEISGMLQQMKVTAEILSV